MQIHEITARRVDELALGQAYNRLKGGVQGAVQGYQTAKAVRQGAEVTKQVADKATKAWLTYAANLKAANPDPQRYAQLYKQTLSAFVQKNLLKGQPINTAINRQEISQLIDQITAAEASPRQVTQLMSKLVQQAGLSQQDVGTQALTKIVSLEPAVIEYRTVTYTINDNGEWANQKTGAVPDESFQAFLDQELVKAGGSAPTPGTAPKQSASGSAAAAKPAAGTPGMTADQISQWIMRNSEDQATLKAALDAINSAGQS